MPLGIGINFGKSKKTSIKIRKIFKKTGEQWQLVTEKWNADNNKWNEI